jgi:hypothetical protein
MANYDVKISTSPDNGVGAELVLEANQNSSPNLKWHVEVKNYVGEPQTIRLVDKLQKGNWIVTAERIEPKAKRLFREHGISYLDASGGLYLKGEGILLFITPEKGKKKVETSSKVLYGKAWTKLFLLLLTKPYSASWPLRDIAAEAGIGLGTVSQLKKSEQERIKILKTQLLPEDLEYVSILLERWAEVYMKNGMGQKLLGTFEMPNKDIIQNYDRCAWSSEVASELLADQLEDKSWSSAGLRAENAILYTHRSIYEVMRDMRLVQNPEGKLKIYTQPWNDNLNKDGIAPLSVIYADLLKGDSRSIKEAQKIEQIYLESIL